MKRCVDLNLKVLSKIKVLLGEIEEGPYRKPHPQFLDSSIGGHVRHIIDFYELYLEGSLEGIVNFTKRKRDLGLESDPRAAWNAVSRIEEALEKRLDHGDGKISVISDSGESFASSHGRELEFLAGHTVHHNAMIVAMCQSLGVFVSPEMALAQSTIEYQNA